MDVHAPIHPFVFLPIFFVSACIFLRILLSLSVYAAFEPFLFLIPLPLVEMKSLGEIKRRSIPLASLLCYSYLVWIAGKKDWFRVPRNDVYGLSSK